MTITKIIFACDESGAKGYADQEESYPGEVGVFAAILVPQELDAAAQPEFQAIYDRYKPATGKLHIADLLPTQQEALREDVYEAIRNLNLPCFWYAIHVAGLNDWHISQEKFLEDAKQPSRIKPSGSGNKRISMHEELFFGLYAHLIAYLEERDRKEVSVEIRTDQIDSPIVANFEEIAERLLSDNPSPQKATGWDTVSKKVVEGQIKFEGTLPDSVQTRILVSKIAINPVPDSDGYVLAADVLANSLNYLLKNRDQTELYGPLNKPQAIAKHPLADHLASFSNWGSGDILGDSLYAHPKSRECL